MVKLWVWDGRHPVACAVPNVENARVFGHRASDGGFLSSGALFEYGPSLASIGMILVLAAGAVWLSHRMYRRHFGIRNAKPS